MWVLVPQPGIELVPSALEVQSLNPHIISAQDSVLWQFLNLSTNALQLASPLLWKHPTSSRKFIGIRMHALCTPTLQS